MGQGEILGIGMLLVGLGAAFWLAIRVLLRVVPGRPPLGLTQAFPSKRMTQNPGAWILIQQGGRIVDLSADARELFRLEAKDPPDLERLVRSIWPAEGFLSLCANEGISRLAVEGRAVEVTSYRLPLGSQALILVTLRLLEPEMELQSPASSDEKKIPRIAEFIQSIGRSLEIETTLRAIQEYLEQVLPMDWIEITLWEPEVGQLVAYRFVGAPGGERRLEKGLARYQLDEGYAGQLARDRKPQVVEDLARQPELRPGGGRGTEALQSLIGIALMIEDTLVGTLAAGSLTRSAFSAQDKTKLMLLAEPAAAALLNARRFRAEQHRAAELSGLAQLAQGFGAMRDPQSLFARLVQSILPLVGVDILGFLIYNEVTRTLEGQEPIYGMPSQFVEFYRVPVLPNSLAEQMLIDPDLIISENAVESLEWEALGLSFLARAASLRDTLLVPLTSGGRMLGYLQASNHTDGSSIFTQDEIHLLTIVANQAAPVIENATLVIQARQRAQRAEALRRIASLASTAATLDEILKFALHELCQLLPADLAMIFLVDSPQGSLKMHAGSVYGRPQALAGLALSLPVDDPQFPFTITGSQHAFSTRNINAEKTIVPFYQQLMQAWQIVSAVAAPMVVRNEGIGEIWLCSRQDGAFDQGDLQVMATVAGQLAGVVEQSALSAQTDASLRRRVDQLTTLTRLSRELSLARNLKPLLDMLFEEALHITGASCGSILLFDLKSPDGSEPVIRTYTGEPPPAQLSEIEKLALIQREAIHQDDLNRDGIEPPHAGVGSALITPILYQNRPAGLIRLHASEPGGFSSDKAEIVQSLAAQAAIALENVSLYRDQQLQESLLERRLDLMKRLFDLSQAMRASSTLLGSLTKIAAAIQSTTGFQVVVMSLFEPDRDVLRRVVGLGLGAEAWEELNSHLQPWSGLKNFFTPEFRVGSAYFIPAEKSPIISDDVFSLVVLPDTLEMGQDAWNADDMLLVPLFDHQEQVLGLISLDAPANGRRPDATSFEALDLLAVQASVFIENRQQISERDARVAHLETDLHRTQQAADQARLQIPLLLRRDLEQTLAIQATNRQLERVRAGLELAELANRQPGALEALRTLAREMLSRLNMQLALVAERNGSEIRLLDVIGSSPAHINPEALFGQRNPLNQLLQDGRMRLVADIEEDPEWRGTSLLSALRGRSFIALPLDLGQARTGGVLVIGLSPLPPFGEADNQTYAQLSRQVGLGIQNLDLLTETRRRLREMDLLLEFSRKLGLLDPRGILSALVETALQVLSTGDAGWVGLWSDEDHALAPEVVQGYADNESMRALRYRAIAPGIAPGLQESPILAGKAEPVELLPLRAFFSGQPIRADVAFAQDYNLPPEELLEYRKATGGRLPVSTLVVPVGHGDRPLGVLVVDHFSLSNAFSPEDESLVMSLAQQSALALENARLFVSGGQRAAQLQALNRVSTALTSSLKRDELISSLLDQLNVILPFETATLWLRQGNTLSVAAANGFADNESRVGITVSVADSALFQEMIRTAKPLLVPDIRLDRRFTSLIEPDHLSWLGIPLIAKAELIGVLALEKHEPGFYSPDHLQVSSTFASQSGVALENARLFEESMQRAAELDQRSQRLALLNRLSRDLSASLDGETILRLTCLQLREALGAGRVSAILSDETGGLLLQAEEPHWSESLPRSLPSTPLIERLRESEGIFSIPDILDEQNLAPLDGMYFEPRGVKSVMFVPLVTAVSLHGWLLVQNDTVFRYSSPEVELARTMANQAAVALQNARLYNETRRLTQDLERRVEQRTSEVRFEHNNTQALLRIITELATSLDLDQVMNRTLTVLNETIGSEQSLILLNEGQIYQTGVDLIPVNVTVTPTYTSGKLVPGSPEREITRWVVRRRISALVENILEDTRWKPSAKIVPTFSSAVAVPLIIGEEAMGVLLLVHRNPAAFRSDQISLIEAAARQFSISLNNAELFNLIRDQAEHLGGLLREQQMESSRSRSILESVADGVLVTDAAMKINLLNPSAERILGLKAIEVRGQSLDGFIGLFGKVGQVWRETIQRWSKDPQSYQTGETYTEQINLDNGRIVVVNLAPVFFRTEFLATVSIFRDITHEVQVDRLKSEFLANVSHELRTPMTSIKGYIEVMLIGAAGELNPQQRHFLEIVKENTERLNNLVADLLDVSRIEAGRVKISLQPLDLREITNEVLAEIRQRSRQENKPMVFEVDIPPDLPVVLGDSGRICQVLANLVNNSFSYTPAGGQVTIRMKPAGREIQIDVQDNGIGIETKDQSRIFERFYRGEDFLVLATAGTGLGLAISKILVEMHRGRIWFFSGGRGEGSIFSFTLPVQQEEE